MLETSLGFLAQLRNSTDSNSWQKFTTLYSPLLFGWLRRHALQAQDAEDIVQEVLAVVVKELPQFQHNRQHGAFRCWLRTILANRLKIHWRAMQNQVLP